MLWVLYQVNTYGCNLSTSAAYDVIEEHMKRTETPPRVNNEPEGPKKTDDPSTAFSISKSSMLAELQVQLLMHLLYLNGFNLIWHLDEIIILLE